MSRILGMMEKPLGEEGQKNEIWNQIMKENEKNIKGGEIKESNKESKVKRM